MQPRPGTRRMQANLINTLATRVALLLLLSCFSSCALFRPRPPIYDPVLLPSGVEIQDLVKPEGPVAKAGDTVRIHYHGTLLDGTVFDSSVERGQPIEFVLSDPPPPPTFLHEGVLGMRLKARRRVTVPPGIGFGPDSESELPTDQVLYFRLELLEILESDQAPAAP